MGMGCAIKGCVGSYASKHRFPNPEKYPDLCKKWVEICGRPEYLERPHAAIYNSLRVCGKHFHKENFGRNNVLLKTAYPTLCLQDCPFEWIRNAGKEDISSMKCIEALPTVVPKETTPEIHSTQIEQKEQICFVKVEIVDTPEEDTLVPTSIDPSEDPFLECNCPNTKLRIKSLEEENHTLHLELEKAKLKITELETALETATRNRSDEIHYAVNNFMNTNSY